jgi:hypothetical protein
LASKKSFFGHFTALKLGHPSKSSYPIALNDKDADHLEWGVLDESKICQNSA